MSTLEPTEAQLETIGLAAAYPLEPAKEAHRRVFAIVRDMVLEAAIRRTLDERHPVSSCTCYREIRAMKGTP